jgi:putative transcriptional regulator
MMISSHSTHSGHPGRSGHAEPARHPPEELLLDYAAAASSAPEAMLIEAHLAFCAGCRGAVQSYQAIGGALFDALEPAWLPPDSLNRTFDLIDKAAGIDAGPRIDAGNVKPALPPAPDIDIGPAAPGWRRLPGGYGMKKVACADGKDGRVWLLKAPGGKGLLRHRHKGDEWTVVMQGAFSDDTGHYGVGDFAQLPDGYEHRPMAQGAQDCVCLIMIRNAPHYTTMTGRLAARFIRL